MLRCERCGRENPDDNRFCGQCGAALTLPEPMAEPTRTVSGPSFLGLGEPAPYRYEDDEEEDVERSSWRAWAVLAVLLVVGGLVWMQWRYSTTLRSDPLNADARPSAVQTEEAPAPPPGEPQQEAAAPSATEQPPTDEPAGEGAESDEAKPDADAPAADEAAAQDKKDDDAAGSPPPEEEQPAEESEEKLADKLEQERIAKGGGESEPAKQTPAENDADLAIARRALAAGRTEEAVRRLWASTSRGSAVAPVLLAQLYLNGDGVERSCEQALVLLNSAARRQNAQARAQLGGMYAEGQCAQRDRVAAYHWYTLALNSAPDDESIRRRREELWHTMTETEREEARALAR